LRVNRYEIDIVARSGALVVIVEVRNRGAGAWTTAFGSMDGAKRRIRFAGERLGIAASSATRAWSACASMPRA
jgi:Holliday junction resolvase-like predicted endonuclease